MTQIIVRNLHFLLLAGVLMFALLLSTAPNAFQNMAPALPQPITLNVAPKIQDFVSLGKNYSLTKISGGNGCGIDLNDFNPGGVGIKQLNFDDPCEKLKQMSKNDLARLLEEKFRAGNGFSPSFWDLCADALLKLLQ